MVAPRGVHPPRMTGVCLADALVFVLRWRVAPDKPLIDSIAVHGTTASVHFLSSDLSTPINPGTDFYVEYADESDAGKYRCVYFVSPCGYISYMLEIPTVLWIPFRYASTHLWNKLPDSFRQPCQSCLDSPPHSLVSSSLSSSLTSSITLSLQAQNLPFQQILPILILFQHWTVFTITGPDRTYHASRFTFSSYF